MAADVRRITPTLCALQMPHPGNVLLRVSRVSEQQTLHRHEDGSPAAGIVL